jgi:hypothetical protein
LQQRQAEQLEEHLLDAKAHRTGQLVDLRRQLE